MTQYVTKFEAWRTASFAQDDAASVPTGWTSRNFPGGFGAFQNRTAQPTGSTKVYGWSCRSCEFSVIGNSLSYWNLPSSDAARADAEVLVGLRASGGDCEIFVRQGGGLSARYYSAKFISNTLYLLRVSGGATTTLASASIPADASGLYYVRLRVVDVNLSASAWGRDSAEPSSPTLVVTDLGVSGVGNIGIRTGTIEFFSAGTGGDVAAAPMLLTAADAALRRSMLGGAPVLFTCDVDVPAYTGSTTVAGRVFRRFSNLPYSSGAVAPVSGEVYRARVARVPTVTREMADLAGGVVKVGVADVPLQNGDGALDDLFRMRLFRMPALCRIGLPTWAWYDLLPYHQGVIQDVVDGGAELRLSVDGSARELDGDVTFEYSTSGPNNGRPIPQQLGPNRNVTPVLTDSTILRYQFARTGGVTVNAVRDRGVVLTSRSIPLTALDTSADWVEAASAHLLAVNDPVQFDTSFSTIIAGSNYFVQSVVSAVRFTVSLTRGGAAVDLTGASGSLSANASAMPWVYSNTGGGIELAKPPAGQVTLDLQSGFTPSAQQAIALASFPLAKAAFPGTNIYQAANIYIKDKQSRLKVLDDLAARGIPVTFARSGALAWRAINFSAIEQVFSEADCFGAPKLNKILQPTKFRVGEPNWTVQTPTDLATSVTPTNVALYGQPQYYLIDAVGIDAQAGLWWGGLVDDPALYRDTLPDRSVGGISATNTFTAGVGYTDINSSEARARPAGVYEVVVKFRSVLLDCGDVVKLSHRRHFFAGVANESDVSPERPGSALSATRQPSLAVVTKVIDDPAAGQQTLTLYRPMPVLFPSA